MSDIAHHVNISSKYSLEFESTGLHCVVSIRFWKGDNLSTVCLLRYRLASDPAAGMLTAIARIFSFLSRQPKLVSVSGCPSELITILEQSKRLTKWIQCPFRFDAYSLPRIMHQRWGSVFRGINFFSLLRFLVTFLDGCQDQIWATESPELSKVNIDLSSLEGRRLGGFDDLILFLRQFRPASWRSLLYLQFAQNCLLTGRPCMTI